MSDLKVAIRIALTFFLIGTLLLAIYFFTMSPTVALVGYAYTGLAVLIGMLYLIVLGFKIIHKKIPSSTGFKCAGIVLINLPIAGLYFYLVMLLMTTARITFENFTGKDISEVSVGGCGNVSLGDLKNGESQTVWIRIRSDCSLVLFYKLDREPMLETPFGYLTHNDGMIATYRIGSNTANQ